MQEDDICSNIGRIEDYEVVMTLQDSFEVMKHEWKADALELAELVAKIGDYSSQKPENELPYFLQIIVPTSAHIYLVFPNRRLGREFFKRSLIDERYCLKLRAASLMFGLDVNVGCWRVFDLNDV